MSSIVIPSDFKYVLASLSLIPFLNAYLDMNVVKFRKLAKVPLPNMFASKEEADKDPLKHQFNCAQKSALNFSEHVGGFIVSALVSGFYLPKFTGVFVTLWVVGRILYHHGYTTGDPKKRSIGFLGTLSTAVLGISGAIFAIKALF